MDTTIFVERLGPPSPESDESTARKHHRGSLPDIYIVIRQRWVTATFNEDVVKTQG